MDIEEILCMNQNTYGKRLLQIEDIFLSSPTTQEIILLIPELLDDARSRNIMNLAMALMYHKYEVSIVTSVCDYQRWEQELQKVPLQQISLGVPDSLWGYFKKPMKIFKAILLALNAIFYNSDKQEKTVICDMPSAAVPFLKGFGNFRVLYFQYFDKFDNRTGINMFKTIPKYFHAMTLKSVDDIFVANNASLDLFSETYRSFDTPCVIYPCIDTGYLEAEECAPIEKVIPGLNKHQHIFLTYGNYSPESNFQLAIDAFDIVYKKIQWRRAHKKIRLVIAGNCDEDSEDQKSYYNLLISLASKKESAPNIIFFRRFPSVSKKTLLTNCVALLYTQMDNTIGMEIIEAMCLGRPIIACRSELTKEYIPKYAGFLLKRNAQSFATAMNVLIDDSNLAEKFGNNARSHFAETFSFMHFARNLKQFIDEQEFEEEEQLVGT